MRASIFVGLAASISIGFASAGASAQTPQPYPPQPPPNYPYYPPPQGYAPPPGYAPPQGSNYVPPPPTKIKYQEGMAPPQGYHIEENPRKGLVIAGYVVLGSTYFLSATIGMSSSNPDDRWLLVPVFGPFVDLGARNSHGCSSGNTTCEVFDPVIKTYLALDGAAQMAGAVLLTTGYLFTKKEFVSDTYYGRASAPRVATWTVVPQVTPGSRYGLMLRGELF